MAATRYTVCIHLCRGLTLGCIRGVGPRYITLIMEYLGAVTVDANACHPNDVAYTAFIQLKLSKSMVSILTSSESLYHEVCCGGTHA